ncbi:hypothetical protein ACSDR0_34880 [Streptosporangium sp. G11]|uniref:hypothetical protein n=1 Tax=Streptosporangium sp. G11 TaxID=3436926 RepID=UPI003EC12945
MTIHRGHRSPTGPSADRRSCTRTSPDPALGFREFAWFDFGDTEERTAVVEAPKVMGGMTGGNGAMISSIHARIEGESRTINL